MSAGCVQSHVAIAVMEAMLAPLIGAGRLQVLKPYRPISAETKGDRVTSVTLKQRDSGKHIRAGRIA